jgi:opacity protein-like surface antigen
MMDVHPARRGVSSSVRVLCVTAFLVLCCAATATAAVSAPTRISSLSGKWKGQYSGAYSGKFTIQWTDTGGKLKGTITLSNPKSKDAISGTVKGKAIKFGTLEHSNAITYSGTWSRGKMSGTYKAGGRGGSWSAHKVS